MVGTRTPKLLRLGPKKVARTKRKETNKEHDCKFRRVTFITKMKHKSRHFRNFDPFLFFALEVCFLVLSLPVHVLQ